jgi:hypothetical protein
MLFYQSDIEIRVFTTLFQSQVLYGSNGKTIMKHKLKVKVMYNEVDRLCGLVVRDPGYGTEMYCVSCEVQTELYMLCSRK